MIRSIIPYKIKASRNGIADLWNAGMVSNTTFSAQNDIPLCPTTATSIPKCLIGFDEAKTFHNRQLKAGHAEYHVNAFIHFYIDDQKFDGKRNSIWLYPEKALTIINHFSGIIAPDFSTNVDFPDPLKRWNIYRMCAFGAWIGAMKIPVISNVRWGGEDTWAYCFDGNPHCSMIAVGSVASGARLIKNRKLFEDGLLYMAEYLKPHTVLVYGSANYPCFNVLKSDGIHIVSFSSKTSLAYERGRQK